MNSCNIYYLNSIQKCIGRGGKVSLVTSKRHRRVSSKTEPVLISIPRQYPGRNENIEAFGKLQQLHFEEECAEKSFEKRSHKLKRMNAR